MDTALPALLAVGASLAYGISDVFAGVVVRRNTVASVALWAQVTGLAVLGAAFLIRRPELSATTVMWGALGGVVGALAVLAFYTALQHGNTAIVAPLAGTGVLIPVAFGLATGDPVSPLVIAGLVLTLAGIAVVTVGSARKVALTDPADTPLVAYTRVGTPGRAQRMPMSDLCKPTRQAHHDRSAIVLAIGAALGFGSFFVILDRAAGAAELAGITDIDGTLIATFAVQIGAVLVTALATLRHSIECLRPNRWLLLFAISVGLLDAVGDFVLTYAVATGSLALIGPLGSLGPVIAVLVAMIVLGEKFSRTQAAGVVTALIGTVLIAIS